MLSDALDVGHENGQIGRIADGLLADWNAPSTGFIQYLLRLLNADVHPLLSGINRHAVVPEIRHGDFASPTPVMNYWA